MAAPLPAWRGSVGWLLATALSWVKRKYPAPKGVSVWVAFLESSMKVSMNALCPGSMTSASSTPIIHALVRGTRTPRQDSGDKW